MTKLVIEGVPLTALNFVKAYCELTGQDEQEYWRYRIGCDIDALADIVGAEASHQRVRETWDLKEAIKLLTTPRGPRLKKLDEETWKVHQRERKKR